MTALTVLRCVWVSVCEGMSLHVTEYQNDNEFVSDKYIKAFCEYALFLFHVYDL